MSHFTALAFISPEIAQQGLDAIEAEIERLMTPYDVKTLTPSGELNPKGTWDWWHIDKYERLKEYGNKEKMFADTSLAGNACGVKDLGFDYIPFAVVTPDGEWHMEGQMGMFGFSSNHDPYWEDKFDQMREQYPDCLVVALDCHI